MTKILTSKLHLKQHLHSHNLTEGGSLENHLSLFNIVADLEAMKIKYNESDLGIILSCSLLTSYVTFRYIILYSWNSLTIDDVYDPLYSNEKMKYLVIGLDAQVEGLVVH